MNSSGSSMNTAASSSNYAREKPGVATGSGAPGTNPTSIEAAHH
jgi:hypothetical protein